MIVLHSFMILLMNYYQIEISRFFITEKFYGNILWIITVLQEYIVTSVTILENIQNSILISEKVDLLILISQPFDMKHLSAGKLNWIGKNQFHLFFLLEKQ